MQFIHHMTAPWVFVNQADACTLQLWAQRGRETAVWVLHGDPYDYLSGKTNRMCKTQLHPIWEDDEKTVFQAVVPNPTHKLRYLFALEQSGRTVYLGCNGMQSTLAQADAFRLGYQYGENQTPDWAGRSLWYQIFPDRFAKMNADDAPFVPTRENRWGGTLAGIREKLPYLQALGVTGVYLTPVFASPSNHRYDTADYTRVDPMLGENGELVALAQELHRRGLRLMLDGVFNHAAYDCPLFQDVVRNGRKSPYWDWFLIYDEERARTMTLEQLTSDVMKTDPPYECFAFAANMPKWNTDHEPVMEYLIGCAERWTTCLALDGWRLDVSDEVSPRFLRRFRRRMRAINPQLLIIGEVWSEPYPWVQNGLLDGTMDYPLYHALDEYLLQKTLTSEAFCRRMNRYTHELPIETRRCQMTFICNHDLPRPLTQAHGDAATVIAALTLLLLLDGEACLYYGDERAMQGGEDPANRGAVCWAESAETLQMEAVVKQLSAFRREYLALPLEQITFEARSEELVEVRIRRGGVRLTLLLHPQAGRAQHTAYAHGTVLLETERSLLCCDGGEGAEYPMLNAMSAVQHGQRNCVIQNCEFA